MGKGAEIRRLVQRTQSNEFSFYGCSTERELDAWEVRRDCIRNAPYTARPSSLESILQGMRTTT